MYDKASLVKQINFLPKPKNIYQQKHTFLSTDEMHLQMFNLLVYIQHEFY